MSTPRSARRISADSVEHDLHDARVAALPVPVGRVRRGQLARARARSDTGESDDGALGLGDSLVRDRHDLTVP